ncbi:MAG: ribonuclease E/G, partial [Alphaproteobacteria bacterium]|nr:ribonuclease E/G [Alphaproteobacteria bacterium]
MSKQMLIDATHSEETRVVVLENGRVEELDVDTKIKKQIKGNIYLAKVVRVEPSLQACFVEYGGNRHGFLAFGEIHPDYYQIPVADREELKRQIAEAEKAKTEAKEETETNNSESSDVELVHEAEETLRQKPTFLKKYKIQEVIHPGQVMLIQVVKEERGNKGAAMTTYLSLAGRFSVLMPNNSHGGGVSRKISNSKDRKELRKIVEKLPIPEGMSVIIRTAGQGKTKSEIKRDYDYFIKTWSHIRELTLKSIAPKLIHEEGDIIKRSLRDGFTTDIDEILVDGEEVFKSTRNFVKMLMPAQVKKVKLHKGKQPLFLEYHVEQQLESIHNNVVQLHSGGYLVIDQTEALVAVDVNSGRATREHDIEETALRTNLETCEELARQLRLRDMAGLIVIDFIDMDEPRNNAAVERKLKEALRRDRARIQVGKMSGFGLMEMSRQRLHSSFIESSYHVCPYCAGKGVRRSTESCAMHALRMLEEACGRFEKATLILTLPQEVAIYMGNNKRGYVIDLEKKYNVRIQIEADDTLIKTGDYKLERIREDGVKVGVQPAPGPRFDRG